MGVLSYEDCTSNPSTDIANCCSLCPPGHGQTEKCTNDTDTKCHVCELGKTFSSPKYDTKPCRKCKTCKDNEREIFPCNTTHDTMCECLLDFYFAEDIKKCQLCDLCTYGSGAMVPCSTRSNTVCRKCENGTFSDVRSATSSCRPCSSCGPNQLTIMDCSDQQDTMCLGTYNISPPHPLSLAPKPLNSPNPKSPRNMCKSLSVAVDGYIPFLCFFLFKKYWLVKTLISLHQIG